jgi:hypothetical protein
VVSDIWLQHQACMGVGNMPILRRKDSLSAGTIFENKVYFWKDPILERRINFGAHAIEGKKETCRKRRKNIMQKENKHGMQEGKPNHARVRVLDNDCNGYKPNN